MGYKLKPCNNGQAWESPFPYAVEDIFKIHGRLYNEHEPCHYNYLKFDTEWSWMMAAIHYCIKVIGIKSMDECTDEEWFQITRICRMYIGVSISQAHHYVVEFIKYYNNEREKATTH